MFLSAYQKDISSMASQIKKEFPIVKYLQGTELLSYEELGVYIKLLEYMWISHGKIPNNDEKIAHILRLKIKKWQNYKKILQNLFVFSKINISHAMIQREYEKLASQAKQNSLNAKQRWGVKAINSKGEVSSKIPSNEA